MVCVVGNGVAALVSAKKQLELGNNVVMIAKNTRFGGIFSGLTVLEKHYDYGMLLLEYGTLSSHHKTNLSEYSIDKIPDITSTCETFNTKHLELLLHMSPKIVSFHFGLPKDKFIKRIKHQGIYIISSATTVEEAKILENSRADAIIAQVYEAGRHRGTFETSYKEGD